MSNSNINNNSKIFSIGASNESVELSKKLLSSKNEETTLQQKVISFNNLLDNVNIDASKNTLEKKSSISRGRRNGINLISDARSDTSATTEMY